MQKKLVDYLYCQYDMQLNIKYFQLTNIIIRY